MRGGVIICASVCMSVAERAGKEKRKNGLYVVDKAKNKRQKERYQAK